MNKQRSRSLVIWAALSGVCFLVFFSCTSTPNSESKVSPVEEQVLEEEPSGEELPPEPEVFTTVNFAQRLQKVLEQGTVEEALALFEELPPEYEDDRDMQLLQASLLVSAGKLDQASVVTDKLLAAHPEDSEVLMLSVMLAKASGDTKAKNAKLKELLAKDPTNSDANVALADEQMLRRNYKLAGQYYRKGLESDPNHIDALSGYGQATYYTGDDRASRAAFNKILEQDPDNSIAYSFLGKLDAVDENYYSAAKNIEKAIAIDGDIFDYWLDYGQYLRYQGKFKEAEEAWIKAKDLQPEYFLGYAYLAGLYDEQNRYDECLQMYRKVIQYNPKYYFAYESVGMLAWRKGDYTESRAAFEKAYTAYSDNISYPLMIAATYLKEGKTKECKTFLSKVMRNRATDSLEYMMLRLYYDSLGDQRVMQKVANESNRNLKGKMMYYLGLFYEMYDNDVMAKKYYTDVLALNSPMFFEYRLAEWAVEVVEK